MAVPPTVSDLQLQSSRMFLKNAKSISHYFARNGFSCFLGLCSWDEKCPLNKAVHFIYQEEKESLLIRPDTTSISKKIVLVIRAGYYIY